MTAQKINLRCEPLPPCNNISFFPSPSSASSLIEPPSLEKKLKKKLSTGAIDVIAFDSALILALLLLILLHCLRRKRNRQSKQSPKPPVPVTKPESIGIAEAGTSSLKDYWTSSSPEGERNTLVLFDGEIYSFELEDLLRASAEILGKGSVGTSYKVVSEEGTTVVVKRLKEVAVTKKEFERQTEILGKMKNKNIIQLRAF